jgi:hypothetical protein
LLSATQAQALDEPNPELHLTRVVTGLLLEIREMISQPPLAAMSNTRAFTGDTVEEARNAAVTWLRDFDAHGPLKLKRIRTEERGGRFVAIVDYSPW